MYIKCVCFWQKSKLHNRESPVYQHNLNEPHKPALMTLIYISARHIYDSKLSFFFKSLRYIAPYICSTQWLHMHIVSYQNLRLTWTENQITNSQVIVFHIYIVHLFSARTMVIIPVKCVFSLYTRSSGKCVEFPGTNPQHH